MVPEGEFRFTVKSVPQNQKDLDVLAFGMKYGLGEGSEEGQFSWVEEQSFRLPYGQGGGEVTMTRLTREEAVSQNYVPYPEEVTEEEWLCYTGWVLHCNYTDSMTSEYRSCVWEPQPNSFLLDEL